jgi:hypothetical protein
MSEITLTGLLHYPIKSCGGTSVESALLDEYGLLHDRRWMVVNPDGKFYTQRELPQMALIQPSISENGLVLNAPSMESLTVPFPTEDDPTLNVTVWRYSGPGTDSGSAAAEWLSDFLKTDCRLAGMNQHFNRQVNPDHQIDNDPVSYADGYPLLLISTESLDDLNTRLETPFLMNRFRPNLVVSGADAFSEDNWKSIQIGEVTFHLVKPCARCTITTVDQTTAERGKEPLTTLSTFRQTDDGRILFGQNMIHAPKHGKLQVGDNVNILT